MWETQQRERQHLRARAGKVPKQQPVPVATPQPQVEKKSSHSSSSSSEEPAYFPNLMAKDLWHSAHQEKKFRKERQRELRQRSSGTTTPRGKAPTNGNTVGTPRSLSGKTPVTPAAATKPYTVVPAKAVVPPKAVVPVQAQVVTVSSPTVQAKPGDSQSALHAAVQKQLPPRAVNRLASYKEMQKDVIESETKRSDGPRPVFAKAAVKKSSSSSSSSSDSDSEEMPTTFANPMQKEIWLEKRKQRKHEKDLAAAKLATPQTLPRIKPATTPTNPKPQPEPVTQTRQTPRSSGFYKSLGLDD